MKKRLLITSLLSFAPFASNLTTSCGINSLYIINPCKENSTFYIKNSMVDNNKSLTISPYTYHFPTSFPGEISPTNFNKIEIDVDNDPVYTYDLEHPNTIPPSYKDGKKFELQPSKSHSGFQNYLNYDDLDIHPYSYTIYWFTLNVAFINIDSKLTESKISIKTYDEEKNQKSQIADIDFKLDYSEYK
ncbi:hypothetical protein [Spiroplasma endosymbiont of Aspidapion aeneum]|uniref:hypothetical protein n=1 Tax=Spiroplasma endosymbiont of Aspidapion aeneum TaxID=3066276 RepID=UPI00313B4498